MADTQKDPLSDLSEGEALLAFSRSSVAMVLTDPHQDDNPIVYVNRAFERVTGYSWASAVGRNCRFLQGPETSKEDVLALRRAVHEKREVSIDLLNYRANGETFMNRLLMTPIFDGQGEVTYFLGIQKDITQEDAERPRLAADRSMVEIQHRVKNHLAMIVGLIRMQARTSPQPQDFDTLAHRVESLQLLYEELSLPGAESERRVSLGSYLGRVASAISHLDGRAGVRVSIDVAPVYVATDTALRLGLILSEVLTNAFQHAFTGRAEGNIEVRVTSRERDGLQLHVSDDGIGMPDDVDWPNASNLGGRIVVGLVEGLDGKLEVRRGPVGTVVNLDLPASAIEIVK
ncbi:PAS domain-containing protein [Roseitranquillus sediminis]|uniref:PAS domain-containing protein n=1 Tax=Roseitranquillus sediminis TaxID=2809051 RepID=UPI001D0C0A8C|nr:PAS domain-containing protein [Roseitranquillus sediminis]MBM9596365.1 PAS domain-containing protein [Roseitranquillus sediminis]